MKNEKFQMSNKIFAILFVLGILLFTGCPDFSGSSSGKDFIPSGMGLVSFSMENPAGRTLFPEEFNELVYTVKFSTTDVDENDITENFSNGTGSFILKAGIPWNIVIQAYKIDEDDAILVGETLVDTELILVNGQKKSYQNIYIVPVKTTTGTFDWLVEYEGKSIEELKSAKLQYKFNSSDGGFIDIFLTDDESSGIINDLEPGSYLVRVIMEDENGNKLGKTEVFHIYPEMVTKLVWGFTDLSAVFDTLVTNLVLDSFIIAPVTGIIPIVNPITGTQYTGIFEWLDENEDPFNDSFVYPVIYRVLITLNAEEGYTFKGLAENSFKHSGAESVTIKENTEESVKIIMVFRCSPVYLDLSDGVMGITITACCWDNDYPPFNLINGNASWENTWIYGRDVNKYNSSWGTVHGSWSSNAVGGWSSAAWGHYNELNGMGIPGAHSFTVDFGEEKDIISFGFYPSGNSAAAIAKPFGQGEIWYSNSPIGLRPDLDGAVKLGTFNFVVNNYKWYDTDISALNDNNPLNTRYMQIRFTERYPVDATGWRDGQLSQLRIGVPDYESPFEFVPALVYKNLDLSSLVTEPLAGVAPLTTFTAQEQFTGTIVWDPEISDVFESFTVYSAILSLTAKKGYTFTGIAVDSFTHTGASSVNTTGSEDTCTVTIIFPETFGDKLVTETDLSALVKAPVAGAAPNIVPIDEDQYTGTIEWLYDDDPFIGNFVFNSIYKAVVSLEAKEGFTFNGIAANSFSYTINDPDGFLYLPVQSISNAANSGIVTLTFKVTPGIKACCWTGTVPTNIINGVIAWNGGWNCPSQNVSPIYSSWPESLQNRTEPMIWNITDCSIGHRYDLLTVLGLDTKAHFFTLDLGSVVDIATVSYYPHGDSATVVGTYPMAQGIIYVSETMEIGADPRNPAIEKVATFDHRGTLDSYKWYDIDITEQNEDNPVSGRYIQVRFTSRNMFTDPDWLNGTLGQLKVGLAE